MRQRPVSKVVSRSLEVQTRDAKMNPRRRYRENENEDAGRAWVSEPVKHARVFSVMRMGTRLLSGSWRRNEGVVLD
jgi:hypothetical protein